MPEASHPKEQILAATQSILKSHGMEDLSMRKVAQEAGMSLGNLQYHFATKTQLLCSLADGYFQECLEALRREGEQSKKEIPETKQDREAHLEAFLGSFIGHFEELSDMCRMFRELWALSSRDAQIEQLLQHYYQELIKQISLILEPLSSSKRAAKQSAEFLVPYFEGYSLVAPALRTLGQSQEQVTKQLTKICLSLNAYSKRDRDFLLNKIPRRKRRGIED